MYTPDGARDDDDGAMDMTLPYQSNVAFEL